MEIVREKSSSGFSAARTNKQKPMLRHVEHPAPNDGQSKKERERKRWFIEETVWEEKLAVTDFVVPPTHIHTLSHTLWVWVWGTHKYYYNENIN